MCLRWLEDTLDLQEVSTNRVASYLSHELLPHTPNLKVIVLEQTVFPFQLTVVAPSSTLPVVFPMDQKPVTKPTLKKFLLCRSVEDLVEHLSKENR
jgi:hypothetical protein